MLALRPQALSSVQSHTLPFTLITHFERLLEKFYVIFATIHASALIVGYQELAPVYQMFGQVTRSITRSKRGNVMHIVPYAHNSSTSR